MNATATPFPFASLDVVSRAEASAGKRLRRAAGAFVRPAEIASVLTEIVGEPVDVVLRRVRAFDAKRCVPESIALAVASPESVGLASAALIEVEAALAAAILARALKHRLARVIDASRAPTPDVIGAMAAVVIAILRRAHAGAPLRVVAAGPAHALGANLAGAHPSSTTAWLTVIIGADAFDARVSLPDGLLEGERVVAPFALRELGEMPIALPLVIATALADRAELAGLAVGDAFVFPSSALVQEGDALVGPVALVPPRGEKGLRADLAAGGKLVLRGLQEIHLWEHREEASAMSPDQTSTTIEVLEDAPVVVRVELGSVQMKAREWADVAPGDVLTLGRKLGAPAILRVGGVEVARGELVQVDGEYGVRILGTTPSEGR